LSAVERLVGERILDSEQRQAITGKIVDTSVQFVDERGKTPCSSQRAIV